MSELMMDGVERSAAFKRLLAAMVAGGNSREMVDSYRPLLNTAVPADLVDVVDSAVADGLAFDVLKPAVSRLINLMHTALSRQRLAPVLDWTASQAAGQAASQAASQAAGQAESQPEGQAAGSELFFAALVEENRGLLRLLDTGKPAVSEMNSPDAERRAAGARQLTAMVRDLATIEIHLRKKENILFPWFEARYPRYRCVRLMWDIHDDIRKDLRGLEALLKPLVNPAAGQADDQADDQADGQADGQADAASAGGIDIKAVNAALGRLYFDINTNIFREECALFPVMLPLMSGVDLQSLFMEAHEYGYAFMDDQHSAWFTAAFGALAASRVGSKASGTGEAVSGSGSGEAGGFSCRTGQLPAAVLAALFSTIHLDMTWVDADDRVRWFSDSPRRIFPRSPAIIGRDVRNCHPGASVGRVVAILAAFRSGARDHEAFWLTSGGRFIHIEYFALRDPDGRYLGTLEASEDLTAKRALSGEKRLAE
jgi:hypothetical protein